MQLEQGINFLFSVDPVSANIVWLVERETESELGKFEFPGFMSPLILQIGEA
jgi:hypothetical protein